MTEPSNLQSYYGLPLFPQFVPSLKGKSDARPVQLPSSKHFKPNYHHPPVKSERHIAFESRLKSVESEIGELRSELGQVWKALQETSSTLTNICGQLQSLIDGDSSHLEPSVPSKASPSTNDFDLWLNSELQAHPN